MPPLVLASRSPRRAEMLRACHLEIVIEPADCDESWHPGEAPVDYARRVALAKAQAAARNIVHGAVILAADTTVWIHGVEAPLGKPRDRDEAAAMLRAISTPAGHLVTTAYAIMTTPAADLPPIVAHETTAVWMREINGDRLERYLDTREWTDKAGAYGIQGAAAKFVERIEGSYTNVVGLPLAQVLEALQAMEAIP